MPGSRSVRRPVVLILVFGIFLVLIGVTATTQIALVSAHFTTSMLSAVVTNDAATVRTYVSDNLTAGDLDGVAPSRAVVAAQQAALASLSRTGEIVRIEVRGADRSVLFSNAMDAVGSNAPESPSFSRALGGEPVADFDVSPADAESTGQITVTTPLLREYLPIIAGGQVRAVFAVWRDATPILQRLDETQRDILVTTLAAALIAAAILYLVFRGAQGRITRQTRELLEATRRDALTGMLNHGAIVEELVTAIDQARATDGNVTVCLIDIDNFRLLNETHAHLAGDRALTAVADLLRSRLPATVASGRYGPDEFLLISRMADAASLEAALEEITAALVDISLTFAASERLPVSVSAGLARYPDHADSATSLLSTAALTLTEAKASGGNSIRMANARLEDSASQSTFDVYQGLIITVDTKDRYTKRHSEDVARYALFLADRIGLDRDTQQTLRLSALLHDVGKVGVPDKVLRKPGALTAEERAIIQQHVALGDAIVRNLPNVEMVRTGIRYHHERWDGNGYLDHLSGEEIPLFARLIAVGDAFSAMTTTRPYRKALSVEDALRRLEDASDTQLDATLVAAFVDGIRTADSPPLPNVNAGGLWTPQGAVA